MKLEVLVREHLGPAPTSVDAFPGGAALLRDGEAWVLVEDAPARALGGPMAWAARRGAHATNVLAEAATGLLARRARWFRPPVSVWYVDGRTIAPASPEPRPAAVPVPPAVLPLRDVIVAAGADPVEEHGVLAGEVAGLEICRAVVDEDGVARLEVGISTHDREAFALVHGPEVPVGPALADLVAHLRAHRRPGAAPHALNRLARERYLRWRLIEQPALVGLATLAPAAPPVPRTNLKDPVPCVAVGERADGEVVVVVCSAGVDLDLVPFAADARDALGPADGHLVLAVPEGDDHPVTRLLAARLDRPAAVVSVPPDQP